LGLPKVFLLASFPWVHPDSPRHRELRFSLAVLAASAAVGFLPALPSIRPGSAGGGGVHDLTDRFGASPVHHVADLAFRVGQSIIGCRWGGRWCRSRGHGRIHPPGVGQYLLRGVGGCLGFPRRGVLAALRGGDRFGGAGSRLLHVTRVAGADRFRGSRRVLHPAADVLSGPGVGVPGLELRNEACLFFHRPLVGVEGGFGDVVEDLHTGVLVPLAHDASRPTAIFWLHIRAGAVGVCVIFIWLFNLIVALAFPSLLSALGAGPNFVFFAVMTALAFLFVKKLVPETKGRSLEAIERDLLHGASAPTRAP